MSKMFCTNHRLEKKLPSEISPPSTKDHSSDKLNFKQTHKLVCFKMSPELISTHLWHTFFEHSLDNSIIWLLLWLDQGHLLGKLKTHALVLVLRLTELPRVPKQSS